MTNKIEKNELAREEIYSPEKVAEILDVKKAFVMRLLRSGELKGSKMGKFWRVTESALAEYYNTCTGKNGKSTISTAMRNKIKYHANIKSQNAIPGLLARTEENITRIKAEIPKQGKYQQVASVAKLRALVTGREEIKKKLEAMTAKMDVLAQEAYAEAANLIDKDPDELEELFQKEANNKAVQELQAQQIAFGNGSRTARAPKGPSPQVQMP